MRCSAAAETRAPKSLSTRRRIGDPCSRGEQHADVAAERGADPVDLLDVEARDQRRHRARCRRGRCSAAASQPVAAAAPGKVGRDDPRVLFGQRGGEEVEVAAVARDAVHADDRSRRLRRAPLGVGQAAEAAVAQHRHLLQRGASASRVDGHQSRLRSQSTMPLPSMPCDLPLTNTPTWPPARPISRVVLAADRRRAAPAWSSAG